MSYEIHGKTKCVNCEKDTPFKVPLDKITKEDTPPAITAQITTSGTTQQLMQPNIVEKVIEKPVEVAPEYMPAFRCKNGNCDIGIHRNQNYKKRPKGKCKNCNQFSGHKDGDCPWCKDEDGKRGEIEELDEDELDDLGIPNPAVSEDEHNHEH